ncbi:hypothetical protein BKA69DRAFT_1029868 [Paraphysoderma sedebokerense]|nr:hypothetical protein BKA69DRAFT_1029868 [Paraphysoderma sedebokerense]
MSTRKRKQLNTIFSTSSKRSKSSSSSNPQIPVASVPSHPLGIKPLGNFYFDSDSPDFKPTRTDGLGRFSALSDEFLLGFIVEYLNYKDLCKLSCVSKAWVAFGKYEEIWKGWVLEKWSTSPGNKSKKWINRSWRSTFRQIQSTADDDLTTGIDQIQIPHFYSDLLYQPWYYSNFPLNYLIDILQSSNFVRSIDCISSPPLEHFKLRYELTNTPVLLRNIIDNWAALRKWSDWDFWTENYGDMLFRAEAVELRIRDYITYLLGSPHDEAPVYLFDKNFAARAPKLCQDWEVPEMFREDLFSVLGPNRPDYRWIIIGPERSGSTMHKDPNSTSAWNAVIKGEKLWILYPPEITPPGVFPSEDGGEVSTPVSLVDWWVNWFLQTKDIVKNLPKDKRPIWCVCRSSEVVFIPNGWWHTVINLTPSIAITQNFVAESNLQNVLSFLFSQRSHISGYGDADDRNDTSDSTLIACSSQVNGSGNCSTGMAECRNQANTLYEDFTSALTAKYPAHSRIMQIVDKAKRELNSHATNDGEGKSCMTLWDRIKVDQPEPSDSIFGSMFGNSVSQNEAESSLTSSGGGSSFGWLGTTE